MATKTKKPLKERFGEFKVKVKDYKAALIEAVNVGYHLGWEAHSICRMCAARAWLRVTGSPKDCENINAWTSITPGQRVRQREKCSVHKVAAAHGGTPPFFMRIFLLPWANTDNAVVKLRRRLSFL